MSFRYLKGLCAWLFGLALLGPMSSASAVAAVRAPVHCPGSGLHPTSANTEQVEKATLCLIEIRRVSRHRGMLRHNIALDHVALHKARLMVHKDYFADIGPAGQSPLAMVSASTYPAGAGYFFIGQNLAWGTGAETTPARIVAAWMASPPHRAIMLDPRYHDAGVGTFPATPAVIGAGQQGATYAMEFGVRSR